MRMINVDEIIINPIIPPNTTLNHLTVNKHQISFINASNINISPYVKGMSNLCPLPWLAPFISVVRICISMLFHFRIWKI
jgi:hypothetical protein